MFSYSFADNYSGMKDKKKMATYLDRLVRGKVTIRQVAEAMGYSERQIWNLKQKYLKEGKSCLIHKGTNRPSPRRIDSPTRQKIVDLYLSEYNGYNFSFFNEILDSDHNIHISYRTLYNILTEYKIKSPEKHHVHKKEKHHRIRPRRLNEGDLVQIDGTPFQWFKWCGDNKYYCIHAGVDDATSKLTAMFMTENECLYGYLELVRLMNKNHGLPDSFYSDRAAIFCVTPKQKDKLTIQEQLDGLHETRTQWQRIMNELGINQILAWSPQAKGRVERMWSTVQGRLPHYFKKYKIRTIEDANIFLQKHFLDIYNEQFGKEPEDKESFYTHVDELELDEVLCARYPAKTDVNGQFKFRGMNFAVLEAKYCACKKIELCVKQTGISVCLNNKYYPVRFLDVLTDSRTEYTSQVLRNIIYDALLKDMKQESA